MFKKWINGSPDKAMSVFHQFQWFVFIYSHILIELEEITFVLKIVTGLKCKTSSVEYG